MSFAAGAYTVQEGSRANLTLRLTGPGEPGSSVRVLAVPTAPYPAAVGLSAFTEAGRVAQIEVVLAGARVAIVPITGFPDDDEFNSTATVLLFDPVGVSIGPLDQAFITVVE